jgi:hypothetical protein
MTKLRTVAPRIKVAGTRVTPLRRGGSRDRGYVSEWTRASAAFRQVNPWCLGCSSVGVTTQATMVDHVRPVMAGGVFWDRKELAAVMLALP